MTLQSRYKTLAENKSLRMLRQYLFVIRQISYKENKKKTSEMDLGVVWNVLNPLLYMIVLSTYYGNVIRHDEVENFPVFVFTGITMMKLFRAGTTGAMHSLVGNKGLIIRTKIPKEVFVYQKVNFAIKEMIYSMIALLPIMMFYKIGFTWRVIVFVPVLIMTVFVITGIGKMLATAYVFFADIDYLYGVLMTLMMFLSEVFIPLTHMPNWVRPILTANPIYLTIHMSRNALVYAQASTITEWVKLIIWATASHLLGNYVFEKYRNEMMGKL